MLDKVINISAAVFLLGSVSFFLSIVDLQFKFMGFLGEYKSIVEYTAMGLGLAVAVVGSQIRRKQKKMNA